MFNDAYVAGAKKMKVETTGGGPLGSKDIVAESCKFTFFKEDGSIFNYGKFG